MSSPFGVDWKIEEPQGEQCPRSKHVTCWKQDGNSSINQMLPRNESSVRVCRSMKYQSRQVREMQFRTRGLEILLKMFVRITLGKSLMCVPGPQLPCEEESIAKQRIEFRSNSQENSQLGQVRNFGERPSIASEKVRPKARLFSHEPLIHRNTRHRHHHPPKLSFSTTPKWRLTV